MGGFIDREFSVHSSKRGRLTYSRSIDSAVKELKRWSAAAERDDVVYIVDKRKSVFSRDGQKWSKKRPE